MALTDTSLSTKLQAEIQLIIGGAQNTVLLKKMCDAIAKAVVDEIQANALVTGTTTVSGGSSSGTHPTTGTVS